ncbi:MAG: TonB-dependent receptor [Rhodospirillaceae bacterium]|nr:TonB-dependent receptor [Rhodospirillaceae bacterium]
MKISKYLLSTTAVMVLGVFTQAAHAQMKVEEIVVTARKSEERLQDVPISVTAFNDKDLTERGMNDLYKVSQFTPGFSFEKQGNRYGTQNGGQRPVIRGMSNIGAEPGAAVFVDGIPFSNNILSFPFDIVERVEIIKGPQAALFGRSTFSGAINLITKKPTNDYENKISVRAAQYNDYEVNLMSRGPIIEDKLFYMAQGRYYDFGGQYRNALDNLKVGQENTVGGNGGLEFRPTDEFRISISGGYSEDDDGLAATVLQDRFSNNCFLNVSRQYYCGVVKRQDQTRINRAALKGKEGLRRNSTRLLGVMEYDAGDFIITSNTGYFDTEDEYGYDSDYIDANRSTTNLRLETSDREEWSTELRAQSAASERYRFMGGVFYYHRNRASAEQHLSTAPTVDFGTSYVDNKAVFGSVGADFTEQLVGTLEMRYAEDQIKLRTAAGAQFKSTFKTWLPRATLDYKFDDNSMIYAVIAKGNKPGALNADPRLPPALLSADEEKSWNYEIGTKNSFWDGRIIMNASAYYVDWTKQQLTDTYFLPTGGTLTYLVNVGKTKVQGGEFTMTGQFSDSFSAGGSYALNDARFVEFNDAEAGQLFGDPSLKGRQTPSAPKHQFSLFGRYGYPVTDEVEGFIRADYSYTDTRYDQAYNLASTGSQSLMNVKIGLESSAWTVNLFVDNLFDDRSPSSVIRYVDNKNLLPIGTSSRVNNVLRGFLYAMADKRRVGVTGSYKF